MDYVLCMWWCDCMQRSTCYNTLPSPPCADTTCCLSLPQPASPHSPTTHLSSAEFLCRAGVGSLTLVDGDTVDTTNRNRQLPALSSTVGMLKTQVVAQRLTDINPDIRLTLHQVGVLGGGLCLCCSSVSAEAWPGTHFVGADLLEVKCLGPPVNSSTMCVSATAFG